jgi:hypothetical protein
VPRSLFPAFASVSLAGFALLGLEVIWTRFLAMFINNSSLAFALMLAMVLAGIALGGLAGSMSWVTRPFASLLLLGAGVAIPLCYGGFPWFNRRSIRSRRTRGPSCGSAFFLQFPVSFLSGAFFTLAGAEFRERIASSQASAGILVLFNTLGAAAGAVVAGFVLLPSLGVEKSFFVLSLVYGAAAATWLAGAGGSRRWSMIGGATWLAALALFPFGDFQKTYLPASVQKWSPEPGMTILAWREGLTETSTYLQISDFGRPLYTRLMTNSYSMSSNAMTSSATCGSSSTGRWRCTRRRDGRC